MALYIRDDGVRQLASELAARQGRSVTETVRAALLEARERLEQNRARRDAKARAVIAELRAMRQGPAREDNAVRRAGAAAPLRFVVDTSALVAIVNGEPEAERCHGLLLDHEPVISCGTLIETLCVMQVGLGAPALRAIDRLIELYGVESVPVDAEQVALAREGMLAYGKGRGAVPAVLNFADLFAYALARQLRPPQLFKGEDFGADRRRARAVNRQSARLGRNPAHARSRGHA